MDKVNSATNKLMNKVGRLFGIDPNYVIGGGFWMLTSQATASLASLVMAVAFSNFFPKDSYGTYRYALSVSSILGALTLSGLHTTIVRSVARNIEGLFKESLWINIKWSLGLILVSLGMAVYYFINSNNTLALAMIFVAILTPFLNGALLYRSYLAGKKKFKETALYSIPGNLIPGIIIILSIFLTKNPALIVLAYLLSNTITHLVIRNIIIKRDQPNNQTDPKDIEYSKHLSLINIINTIADNSDKVLLFHSLGPIGLSTYSFATAIPEQIRSVFKIIPTLAVPKFSEKTHEEIHRTIYGKIAKLFLVGGIVALGYAIIAPFIYKIFFPQYIEAILFSQVFGLVFLFEGGLSTSVFKAHRAVKEQYLSDTASGVFKISALFSLTFLYGIWGVIVARILTRMFTFFFAIFLLRRHGKRA